VASELEPGDVLSVADQLLNDFSELSHEPWTDCALARVRSAVSRAYYSTFLTLRARLLKARSWPSGFPTTDVHAKIRKALAGALGPHHSLVTKYRSLLDQRKQADYEPDLEIDRDTAIDRYDDACDAIDTIEKLSEGKIRDIANRVAV
jgi:uncharacterized protein (UPF0332 family)